MKSLMGIDLGTSCGFARLDIIPPGGVSWTYGTWDCSITKFESRSIRFEKFGSNLGAHLALGVDKVFYEAVRGHRGTDAAHIYGAFLAKLQEVCDHYGVSYIGLPVQTIKRFATGKGNAPKDRMIAAVEAWGFRPSNDDEADALALLRCGWETRDN